jgi:hypothetical protein
LNPFMLALALLDELADAGGRLSLTADGVALEGDVPEALTDRLAALCGSGEARHQLATNRALRAVLSAPSRAARELLVLGVPDAAGLPVPFTLTFRRGETYCQCSTSREVFEQATRDGVPTFLLRELDAAALAAEEARATPAAMDSWLKAKRARPDWRVTPETAGVLRAERDPAMRARCFGELLGELGCELVDVHLPEAA